MDMTATDELRRMLDERGVKWDELQSYEGGKMTRWRDSMGRYVTAYDEGMVTFFDDFYWQPTPQQAIDATLGRGTCHNVHEPPKDATFWPAPHFKCSKCGATHISMDYVFYCPNCGAKVVDA